MSILMVILAVYGAVLTALLAYAVHRLAEVQNSYDRFVREIAALNALFGVEACVADKTDTDHYRRFVWRLTGMLARRKAQP